MTRIHPNIATKTTRGGIPPDSARAGAQDDSLTDHTVVDFGTKTTMTPMMISMASDGGTALSGHKLQSCICGWKKITSEKGLKIHQGRMKCLKELTNGPRVDHYFLRGRANQSIEAQWQETHHSPQGIRTPDEAQPGTAPLMDASPDPSQPQSAVERKMDGQKSQILWPKSFQKKEWGTVDSDLVHLLGGLKGGVERKLDKMGEIIYSYGAERFGVKSKNLSTQKKPSGCIKSRRQQDMERLVKERRSLRKQ